MENNDYLTVTDMDVEKKMRKIQVRTQKHLDLYARDGLRTLCIAKKVKRNSSFSSYKASTPSLSFLYRRPLLLVVLIFSKSAILTHHKDPGFWQFCWGRTLNSKVPYQRGFVVLCFSLYVHIIGNP